MQTILPRQIDETRPVFSDDQVHVTQIARYVKDRQNQDGGYTFAQWTESSAQDTYFALHILQMLGTMPEHCKETIQFLQGLQNADGSYDSINVAYCCVSVRLEYRRGLLAPGVGFDGPMRYEPTKFVEERLNYDLIGMLKQIGVM
jgi:hypothetical protein